jgi:hypothetical protein
MPSFSLLFFASRKNFLQERTMWRAILVMTSLAPFALGYSSSANAGPISVVNASFENPVVAAGSASPGVPGWTVTGTGSVFFPVAGEANHAPDGNNVAATGTNAPGAIFQDLAIPVVVGHQYELDVFVGTRADGFTSHYLVELLAGATTFASQSGIPTTDGSFFAVTVSGIGSGSGDLGVRLGETGQGQTLFDNVRVLDLGPPTTGVIPEPSSIILSGIGALYLTIGSLRRRRRARGDVLKTGA